MVTQNNGANQEASQETGRFTDKLLDGFSKLITLVITCAVLYGAILAFEELDQPITKVTIEGDLKHLEHSELATLIKDQMDGGFLTVDLRNLQNVLQGHPWVGEVSIQRQWPSYLQIDVVEEVPIARWGDDAFLNRLGDKLTISDNSDLDNLPLLTAEFGSSSEVMKQYQRLAELLLPTGLKLSKLQLDGLGAWRLETSKGIRLVIGRNHVGEKIRRLVSVWESDLHLQSDNIETIDLRYPNGLAVALRNPVKTSEVNTETTDKNSIVHG
jgi:cell division protein FtsQ